MTPEPFHIDPKFVHRIWGMRSLAPIYPEQSNLAEPIGEAWLTGLDCKVASGPFAGKTLGEAWREMPAEWRGSHFSPSDDFPLLVKFIFPTDKLSIQVHPDDAYASVHEKAAGGRGKTEMWHVVSAEPGATLLAGLKTGVTKEKFAAALADHTLESLFQSHEVHAGDTFFIPAGMPHTIGPHMIICEVQQYSDLTYRVYDYDRRDANGKPRELHIKKALAVTQFEAEHKPRAKHRPTLQSLSGPSASSLLAASRYFATERWDFTNSVAIEADPKHFDLLIVLSGSGALNWSSGTSNYQRGECWLLPASSGNYSLLPSTPSSIIRTYVPDISTLQDQTI